ncbi:Mis6 domain-containing protein [Sclerotinia borealis F-4128]|uniref:Mis6 domain-containing protein n=1 Tax=Sclerotinia borealis (strain F-4128) TaxID=1432307 RepID=W9C940_SCLBF|nr:Mis6 domain-containing protein [Sclerotinia borealis F-4128]
MTMDSPFGDEQNVDDILDDLENASRIPAKQRSVKISRHVERLCSRAYEEGLSNASLEKLIDIITLPNELDQGSIGSLIRHLYPTSKVTGAIVIKVVGSLGHGQAKPSYAAQAALLKWIVLVYDVLENQKVLSQLYAVLFNLLDTIALRYFQVPTHAKGLSLAANVGRSQLCHVLSLITRRKHVRPFRIQCLMQWTRKAGHDPVLVGLLRVYKDYYPEVIVGDATSGRASVFTHPNREWRARLGEIQEDHLRRIEDELVPTPQNFRVSRKSVKERKHGVLPEVHTSYAQDTPFTLEEVEEVDEFVQNLEKIELPNQLVAAINDPLLQKLLHLRSSEATLKRIDYWLLAFFEDQLENSQSSQTQISDMLKVILRYTRSTKALPSACFSYFKSLLPCWNGTTNRDLILELLSYTLIGSFDELYQTVFCLLEDAVIDGTHESQLTLLEFYKALLNQWTLGLLLQTSTLSNNGTDIAALISHVNELTVAILQQSSSVSTCSKILDFYEVNASLISHPTLTSKVRIATPSAQLVYTLYFSSNLSIIARIFNILALYKRAFEVAMAPRTGSAVSSNQSYPKEYVNHFNGFLMDICNCLWRSRAFYTTDVNALGCLLPELTMANLSPYISKLETSLALNSLFSISFSPALCHVAITYVRELEDQAEDGIVVRHAGPVTQISLKKLENDGGLSISWQDYRLGILRYLEGKGFLGVGELMYNTVKHLMAARQNAT